MSLRNNLNVGKLVKFIAVNSVAILCLVVGVVRAQIAGPGWVSETAPLVSLKDAAAFYAVPGLQAKTAQGFSASSSAVASSSDPEIVELARGLQNDAVLIYEYVLNNIDYVPYYGHLKNPVLTLLERSGNDFDQAELLIALLRAAGHTANFVHGDMVIPTMGAANQQDVAHWLDVSENVNTISAVLGSGGIPGSVNSTTSQVSRVWVRATTQVGTFDLDPAFKVYDRTVGIALGTAMRYEKSVLLLFAGGVTGTDYVQNINEDDLNSLLTDYSTELATYIKTNHADSPTSDIVGGSTRRKVAVTALPGSLPFSQTINGTWTEIPSQYIHTARFQIGSLDTTLEIPDFAGKRLSLHVADSLNEGSPPTSSVITETVDMGTVNVGEFVESVVYTHTNNSAVDACVSFYLRGNESGAYSIEGTTGDVIPAGGSQEITVKFDGTNQVNGTKTATLAAAGDYCFGPNPATGGVYLTGMVGTGSAYELRLDDTVLVTAPSQTGGNGSSSFTVTLDHKYPNGAFGDQTSVYNVKDDSVYVVVSDFGGSEEGLLLRKRQKQLEQYRADGLADSNLSVLLETLNVMGQTWMHQTTLTDNLLQEMTGTHVTHHHRVGLMAQESGYYIDVKTQYISPVPRNPAVNQATVFAKASAFIGSALEHSVLEQLQGASYPAVSTVKVISLANANGNKIFRMNSGNYSAIRPQLSGYNAGDIAALQNAIYDTQLPSTLILPSNGQITLEQWSGKGYMSYAETGNAFSMGMIIGGGYFGGFGGIPTTIQPAPVYNSYIPTLNPVFEIPRITSLDPVDLYTGSFVYSHQDLVVGQAEPRGLSFTRYYDSNQNNQKDSIGLYGWTHNYDIGLNIHSDMSSAVGRRKPEDAVTMLVGFYAITDLLKASNPKAKDWTVAALIAQWITDELFENAASLQRENQSLKFIKLPDLSYSSPPGVTSSLVKSNSGLFSLQGRFGGSTYFNANNKVSTISDADGNRLTFSYYTSGSSIDKLHTVSDEYGHTMTLFFSSGRLYQVASEGLTVNYDSIGSAIHDLASYTDADNKVWTYEYQNHRMTKVGDPLATTLVTNTYDSLGRVFKQTMPRDTGTATFNLYFTDFRNVEAELGGGQTVYFFDKRGRRTAVQDALGNITKFEFDNNNNIIKQTDPRGNETQFVYDDDLNLRFTVNALSQLTENVYDSLHRLTDTIDPLTHTTEFEYDNEHHLELTRDPVGNEFTSTFYPNGAQKTLKDGRDITTNYTYDTHGNLETSRLAVTPAINYNYNAIGLLASLTDQAGSTTSFIYNDRSQVEEITDPLNKKTVFTYDDAGRLKTLKDRKLNTTIFDYTPSGKVKTINYANNPDVNFAYSLRDNLDTMTDAIGTTSYGYDAANQLTSIQNPYSFNVGYRYDAAGNLDQLTYPGNKTVTYTYDALNRLKTVTIDWLPGTPTTTYNYDDAGRLDFVTNFNGSITDYTFDDANRLTDLVNKKSNNTILSSQQFTSIDGNGNRLQEVREEPIAPNLSTPRVTHTYNPERNRLTSTTNDSFTYNDEGEQRLKSGLLHIFDDAHRLKKIGTDTLYFYDGANNRLRVQRGSVVNRYIYDANNNLLAEANNGTFIQRYFIHGLGLLGMVEGNNLYTYHFDATGNTLAMTNASQTIVNSYAYSAYGKIAAQNETIAQPFKYVGQYGVYYEADHNLYYMRARYYDPEIGRFISEDPIGFEGGDVNLYAYVSGNPINYNDPSGTVIAAAVGLFHGARLAAPYIVRGVGVAANAMRTRISQITPTTVAKAGLDFGVKTITGLGGLVQRSPLKTFGTGLIYSGRLNENEIQVNSPVGVKGKGF